MSNRTSARQQLLDIVLGFSEQEAQEALEALEEAGFGTFGSA